MIKKAAYKLLLDNLRLGNSITDSCKFAGISREAYYQWLRNKTRKAEIEKAELEPKKRCIALVLKAALTHWQASAWYLERKHGKEFALQQKLEHSGKMGVTTDFKPLSIKELKKLAKLDKE